MAIFGLLFCIYKITFPEGYGRLFKKIKNKNNNLAIIGYVLSIFGLLFSNYSITFPESYGRLLKKKYIYIYIYNLAIRVRFVYFWVIILHL